MWGLRFDLRNWGRFSNLRKNLIRYVGITDLSFHGFWLQTHLRSREYQGFTIDFLNSIFVEQDDFSPIVDIEFLDKEAEKYDIEARSAIFDMHCRTSDGKEFIVEMQNSSQEFFVGRSLYYVSRMMAIQGMRGRGWSFELTPVYFVALMNFSLPAFGDDVLVHAAFCNLGTGKPISGKVRFGYIQLPKFGRRRPDECETAFDQWIYVLKNMEIMERMPFVSTKDMFRRLDEVVSYAALSESERKRYDAELKVYRDMTNQLSYAEKKGREEGIEEGRELGIEEGIKEGFSMAATKFVINMLAKNMDEREIAEIGGLSVEEVREIRATMQ